MESKTIKDYIKELEKAEKETAELLKDINNIVDILINEEITLTDIVANEEQLKDRCDELQDKCKEIIRLRQWIDFEELGEQLKKGF